jgi:hypothetical protein
MNADIVSTPNYALIENHITTSVKEKGTQLLETAENLRKKNIVNHLHRVLIASWPDGIFKLDFNGAGTERYYRLSDTRREQIQALDSRIQEVVANISTEIIEDLSLKQHVFKLAEPHLGQRLFSMIKSPGDNLKTLLDACHLTDVYNLNNDKTCVLVFKDAAKFNPKTVLKSLLTNEEYNNKLLDQFMKSIEISISTTDLTPQVVIKIHENEAPLLKEMQERYRDESTKFSEHAKKLSNCYLAIPGQGIASNVGEMILELIKKTESAS